MSSPDPRHDPENVREDDDLLLDEERFRRWEDAMEWKEQYRKSLEETE